MPQLELQIEFSNNTAKLSGWVSEVDNDIYALIIILSVLARSDCRCSVPSEKETQIWHIRCLNPGIQATFLSGEKMFAIDPIRDFSI